MTANAIVGNKEKCIQAGMNGYIAKPMKLADIESFIQACGQRAAGRG